MSKRIQPDYHTVDGNPIWLRFPWRSQFTLEDIKRHMIGMRRYNGGLDCRLVTHSNLVAELARYSYDNMWLWLRQSNLHILRDLGYCAWHDAQETLIQDLIHGNKEQLPEFKYNIEPPWEERMLEFIGLDTSYYPHALVEYYDKRALLVEMKYYGHSRYEQKVKDFGQPSVLAEELYILNSLHCLDPELQWRRLMHIMKDAVKAQGEINGKSDTGES